MPKFKLKIKRDQLDTFKTAASYTDVKIDDDANIVADEVYLSGSARNTSSLYDLGILHYKLANAKPN